MASSSASKRPRMSDCHQPSRSKPFVGGVQAGGSKLLAGLIRRPDVHVDPYETDSESTDQIDNNQKWEHLKKWAASCVVMYAAAAASIVLAIRRTRNAERTISDVADYERHSLLNRLTNVRDEDCHEQLRMSKHAFARLVCLLKERGHLRDNAYSRVEERVAKFLIIIGQNVRNRNLKFFWQRSSETVSRHFHQVLRAVVALDEIFLRQPTGSTCPLKISSNRRFWPYFKDCVGAIDGTHFRVKVLNDEVRRYRGRKSYPTQNVLAACSFDLHFTYVLTGWEGSASDSRILNDALTREIDKLIVPEGKYYLVDAGFQLKSGFLAPYRSTRYHLSEFRVQQPENERELFNHRHASLRNAIERAFGVLKKRFPMLASGSEAHYDLETQGDIVLAGCILHNYLMGVDPFERLLQEVDEELRNRPLRTEVVCSNLSRECREGEILREKIASKMYRDYCSNNQRRENQGAN